MGEATVPAEQPAAGQAPRVSAPDVDSGGTGHPESAPRQGSRPPVGLIWRVGDRATFQALRSARRARRGLLTVAWAEDGVAGPPRVAFTVGRRVGPAVARNRVRRRLRELARRSELPGGAWMVSASAGASSVPFSVLARWWDGAVASLVERRP
jgi:ribonuclease P protein component